MSQTSSILAAIDIGTTKIVTIAGIHGTINKVNDDNTVMLETSPGSYIKIEKSAISMEWSAALNKPATEEKK
jgi:preprotein translocase subunit YajC